MIEGKYFGLYRGYVVDNDDSQQANPYLGRIRVSIPEVYGEPDDVESLPWAWPCVSIFGGGVYDTQKQQVDLDATESDTKFAGGMVAIPPVGATVWIMFEQGDPQVPVWMGTWIGKATEMPQAAKQVGSVVYPQIFVLKMPYAKDMYIRAISDKVFELSFDDMLIQMQAETSPGANDAQIYLWSNTANIKLKATNGKITLDGKTVDILSENNMNIQCGRFKRDPVTQETIVDTVGDLYIHSTNNSRIHIWKKGAFDTSKLGELHAATPKASGFDKHETINDQELIPE
jgi:hypothetical protein